MQRRLLLGMVLGLGVTASGMIAGCSGESGSPAAKMGTLSLPLSTQGASGTEYRLRNAVFQIRSEYDYYGESSAAGAGSGNTYTVSSEDDPSASSLSVAVESGYYYVRLLPGWHMEKVEDGTATNIEATLLSGSTQWVYVSPHSTRWVEYQFGIGDRALWFNGNLNINLHVYEDPDELYGTAGAPYGHGGDSGVGGTSGGGTGVGGSSGAAGDAG